MISYVVEAGEVSDKAEFLQTIRQLESINEDKIMTLAEQFRQEGFKKGIEKGLQQGAEKASHKIAVTVKLLGLGLNLEQISQATGLPSSEV